MSLFNYFNSWSSNCQIILNSKKKLGKSYLLDSKKNDHSIIEKYIIDIVKLKFQNIEDYHIEFGLNSIKSMSICYDRCENNNYIIPLFSFYNFIDDSTNPFVITNISMETYNYKLFEDENEIILSYPKKNKIICFDGNRFNGFSNNDNQNASFLFINIWDRSKNIEIYNNDYEDILLDYETNPSFQLFENNENVYIDNSILNDTFFEKILYFFVIWVL